jgi:hypothetical protein
MAFQPFVMERWQSTWEHRVRFNLSESGVHPLSAHALLELADTPPSLLARGLGYPQSNGSDALRAAVAALYRGATGDQVLVTSGSAEANFVNCWALLEPGDHVAVVLPTYMQTPGLARTFGATVTTIPLREELGWQPDPADIAAAITPRTRLVVVTNPNNPTGAVLAPELADEIVRRADTAGAWLLADEVYQGAERVGAVTASFWGRGERVVVVNGLSKAYGLPGLRIGWCVGPAAHIAELWARKDYTTIGPSVLGDALALLALRPDVRERILARTRGIIRDNWPILEAWLRGFGDEFTWRAPDAGAICWARYRRPVNSSVLAETLRAEHDVLIVPGDQFDLDGYVRFGFGPERPLLEAALARVAAVFGRQEAGR